MPTRRPSDIERPFDRPAHGIDSTLKALEGLLAASLGSKTAWVWLVGLRKSWSRRSFAATSEVERRSLLSEKARGGENDSSSYSFQREFADLDPKTSATAIEIRCARLVRQLSRTREGRQVSILCSLRSVCSF